MELFNNESYFNETLVEDYEANFLGLVCSILPIITLVGNGAVLLAVKREKNLQNSTNFLIVSLAVADLLVGLIVMPWGIYALVIWFQSRLSSSRSIFIIFSCLDYYRSAISGIFPTSYANYTWQSMWSARRLLFSTWWLLAWIGNDKVMSVSNTQKDQWKYEKLLSLLDSYLASLI